MEFFPENTKIPFMKQRFIAITLSVIIFILSFVSIVVNGLHLGLDFTGGTAVEVSYQDPVEMSKVKADLTKAGFPTAQIQGYDLRTLSVRVAPSEEMTQDQLKEKLIKALPGATLGSLTFIGPQVGKKLMTNGILAIVLSLILCMAYIAMRFEMRFAISAAIALIHDPILILGIFSFFNMEFNMIVLTGILTVIGYSLNDTIVVYDRVRENFRRVRKASVEEIMDLSINQTLSRTIMTSGLTLLVVIALYVYGGEMVHGFSLALIIGVLIGTYSSIYIAGTLAIMLGLDRAKLMPVTSEDKDDAP